MKMKYIIGISFIIPMLVLAFTNLFEPNLSSVNLDSINFICSIIILITVVDVLFIAFKRVKIKPAKS
ncbi:hypothetical protein CXF71_10285 [Colwellia sp. 12G3]|nr:hypothetical protein CXF71_10285 [Colwellia sp. 12G3]